MGRPSQYFEIKTDAHGNEHMEMYLEGIALLRLVLTDKGTAFTREVRIEPGLDGLPPQQVNTRDGQLKRVYRGYAAANHLDTGRVYPPPQELQEVSFGEATRGIRRTLEEGVARNTALPERDVDAYVRPRFRHPGHQPFVGGKA